MKIESLILEKFRGIGIDTELEIPLEPDLTVLAGGNGTGKSSILDALAILLSWATARIRRSGGSGMPIPELSINNSANFARIGAKTLYPSSFSWQLVKTRGGHASPTCVTELEGLTRYSKTFQQRIAETQENCGIPLFAYYPVNRAVLDIPLRIRQSHQFNLLEAWDDSLKGAANFRHFFEWFRNREDLENEQRVWSLLGNKETLSPKITADFEKRLKTPQWKELARGDEVDWGVADPQIEAVRKSMQRFLPGFSAFSVRRNPLRMTTKKDGVEIRVDQLSDGEKCLIALVGDLARRLAIANTQLNNPLDGDGIVLIDEVDLHLHPAWQRRVLYNLRETFPNCQFIVSTHSPQVLGEAEARQIRLLRQDEKQTLNYFIPVQAKGLNSNEILDELMRSDGNSLTRNQETQEKIDRLFGLIDQGKFTDAKALIVEMKQQLHGGIPDIVRAESLIFMLDEDG